MIKKAKLFEENNRLKRMYFIFQNIGVGTNSTVYEKEIAAKEFKEKYPEYTDYEICNTIKLNRGTFFNFLNNKVKDPWFKKKENEITPKIIKLFNDSNGTYGQNRIALVLRAEGYRITTTKISEIMKENNLVIRSKIKRPKSEFKRPIKKSEENILDRKFKQEAPNLVWVSDFLEFKIKHSKYYLCAIMDLYARAIISWKVAKEKNDQFALDTFKTAYIKRGKPKNLIFHTDCGTEYKSNLFKTALEKVGVKQSFSCPGSPNDNAVMEGFYSTLRREKLNNFLSENREIKDVIKYLSDYFEYYNYKRVHTTNNGTPPLIKEKEYFSSKN